MKSHTHRFHQATQLGRKLAGGDYLLPGKGNILLHGAVALHAQRFVVPAGIRAAVAAGGTFPAAGVGIAADNLAGLQGFGDARPHGLYDGTYFVARDYGIQGHGVATQEGIKVTAAKAHILQFEQDLALSGSLRNRNINDAQFLGMSNLDSFHHLVSATGVFCKRDLYLKPYQAQTAKQMRGTI